MFFKDRLKYFPVSFFSVILGLVGFTIAYQKMEQINNIPIHVSDYFLICSTVLFLFIVLLYILKIFLFPYAALEELHHPIKLSFFPTFSISIILLSIAFLEVQVLFSKYLLVVGVIVHLFFTLYVISMWMHKTTFSVHHMNPSWFIPVVGNMLIPVAGIRYMPSEVSWFFFSIGLVFWGVLLTIFFNRIIFHTPLPEKLLPTLFILIAPPSLGFISLVKLTGQVYGFAMGLYYVALFFTILLFFQINLFRRISFFLSWWAYSFPIAACTIASILAFHETQFVVYNYIACLLFAILHVLIIFLVIKTIGAIVHQKICVEE